jgi:hypothetical protein
MTKKQDTENVDVRTLRTARTLIDRHGDGALAFAETQAERLAKDGSATSAAEWRAVASAIRELSAGVRKR